MNKVAKILTLVGVLVVFDRIGFAESERYEIAELPGFWNVKKLVCPEDVNWQFMDFADGKVVWKEWTAVPDPDYDPPNDMDFWLEYTGHIMQYDGNSVSRISIDAVDEFDYPVTSERNVTWRTWRRGVTFFDSQTGATRYLSETDAHNYLSILGSKVAWDDRSRNSICIYEGSDVNTITEVGQEGGFADLGEAGVVFEYHQYWPYPPVPSEIYFYDGTLHQITHNSIGDSSAQISGHSLTWIYWPEWNKYGLRLYDLQSDTMLTLTEPTRNGWIHRTRRSMLGNQVVWMQRFDSEEEFRVMYYDGEATRSLGSGWWPTISQRGIVWSSAYGNEGEIHFFDGLRTYQITDNDFCDERPIIGRNYIVWWGKGPEHGQHTMGDIYVADLTNFKRTITVDDDGLCDFNNIQDAIDSAFDGDTIIVADGTYTGDGNRDIDFLGKAITVRSQSGPENCIIDCNGTETERHRGFRFSNNEDANSVLEGFTIINGYAPEEPFGDDWRSHGGAIFCTSSSPTVNNCVIRDNTARAGAGIYCEDGSPTFKSCTVSMNHGTGGPRRGGGIRCHDGNSTISDCTVNANEGSGIACARGNPVITNCTVNYNKRLGITCGGSNPTIANCTISGNSAEYTNGAGIALYFSSGTVTDCNINSNTNPDWEGGGGITMRGSSTTIANCTITGNSTRFGAGGISCEYFSNPTIINCVIRGNYATYGAAGIDCEEHSDPTITNCIISSNFGPGVLSASSRPVISNCTISMNQGIGIGGDGASATIINCIVSGNSSAYSGGGIGWYGGWGTTTIANCTINDNKAERNGGGVWCDHHSNIVLTNCILWGNTASEGNQIAIGSPNDQYESTLTITYSDVQGGEDDAYVNPGCELNWGIGNIDADLCFVEAGYWDINDVWADGDYHLWEDSPCINTGDPNYIPEPNETDLDGNPRIVNDRIDMGAYEYVPPVEVAMHLAPRKLNCRSKGKYLKAHITLPEKFLAEDIDVNEPAIAEPMGVESESIKVLGPDKIEIAFDRQAFCDALTEDGEIEVEVTGSFVDGLYFSATDTIRIIGRH